MIEVLTFIVIIFLFFAVIYLLEWERKPRESEAERLAREAEREKIEKKRAALLALPLMKERTPHSVIIKDYYEENNLNYTIYRFTASERDAGYGSVYFEIMDGVDPNEYIKAKGFELPYELEKVDFPPPTTEEVLRHIQIYGMNPPFNAVGEDVRALIDRYTSNNGVGGCDAQSPNPELIEYATKKEIKFSYYIGKKALYKLIFDSLENRDKIAFYIFSVYRDMLHRSGKEASANPLKSEHYPIFLEFADSKIGDTDFLSELSKIEGHTLRYFSKYRLESGRVISGGDTECNCYREALDFLKKRGVFDESAEKAATPS